MSKKRLTKAERRRRRKLIVICRMAVTGLVFIGLVVLIIVLITRCAKNKSEKNKTEAVSIETTSEEITLPETTTQPSYTIEDCKQAGVDELGSVPILMYHRVYDMKNSDTQYTGGNVDVDGYNRTAEAFEADLEQYYSWGYQCERLTDFIDGNIQADFGKSPIVITFDDGCQQALISGFDANGDPIFKDNSALAILERVKARHPDFKVTATFFLNSGLFENGPELDAKLIKWMVNHGYDIGNHTMTHPNLPDLSAEEIQEQVGYIYNVLDGIIPGQYVNIVALPFGAPTDFTSDSKYDRIMTGSYNGTNYNTKAALICGWTYENSIFTGAVDLTYVKRIRGYDNNGENFDIQMNFELLNDNRRYVSDGNPDTITFKEDDSQYLGKDFGKTLITY